VKSLAIRLHDVEAKPVSNHDRVTQKSTVELAPIEIEALLHEASSRDPDLETVEMMPLLELRDPESEPASEPEPPRLARGSDALAPPEPAAVPPRRQRMELRVTDIMAEPGTKPE
jgi:hypothetical protein